MRNYWLEITARCLKVVSCLALLVGGLLILPTPVQAIVTFGNDTTLTFTGLGLNLTVKSGSIADSLTVGVNEASVTVGSGQIFTVENTGFQHITNSQALTVTSCTGNTVQVVFNAAGTYTFSPTSQDASCPRVTSRTRKQVSVVAVPSAEIELTADDQVRISWTDVANATTYRLWRGEGNSAPAPLDGAEVAKGIGEYTDTTVSPGASYVYRLQAQNDLSQAISAGLSITIPGEIVVLPEEVSSSPVVSEEEVVPAEEEAAPAEESAPEATLRPAAPAAPSAPATPVAPAAVPVFNDVPATHWLITAGYAERLQEVGVTIDRDGKLQPNDKLNRAELLQMVYTAFDVPTAEIQAIDTKDTKLVTRAETLQIIARVAGFDIGTVAVTGFKDVRLTDWFAPPVRYFKENGIVNGYENGNFRPTGNITRAEAMKVIAKSLDHQDSLILGW